ncbi:hypothetical protein [Anaeromicrobium sediminis]|uniref:hypothetical protein n=1 Tax=Anaeromicrobium sediminis TaxID=1478221 RepID=UPI001A9A6588|nr:hypothetical protein [Anaeromicrobium sediminis]
MDNWVQNKVQMLETTKDIIEKTNNMDNLKRDYFKGYERDPRIYDMYFAYFSNIF